MPKYKYAATDAAGKKTKGTMNAANEQELYDLLRNENKYLVDFEEENLSGKGKKIKTPIIADFCRQLGTLLGAGVSLIRALNIIASDEGVKPDVKKIYNNILKHIRQGISFSDALELEGSAFPTLLINMFRSAEASGRIDITANKMAVHYEKENKLMGKIKSASTYPIILLCLVVAVVLIMFTFILPQFKDLFAGMELPIYTRIVMAASDVIKKYWYVILIVAALLVYTISLLLKFPKIRHAFDRLKVKIPKIGPLLRTIYTGRFARTLSSLYSSGLPIILALQVGKGTVGNTYISDQFDKAIQHIRQGETLSSSVSLIDGFQKKLASSISIGEETGRLDVMLDVMAETYEYESEVAINRLVTMLEPLMIVIMAVVVGFIMMAVMVPLISSYGNIG